MNICSYVLALPPFKKYTHFSAFPSLHLTMYFGDLSIFIHRNFTYLFIQLFSVNFIKSLLWYSICNWLHIAHGI